MQERQVEVRINRRIRVPEVRLIDEQGEQRGVVPIAEALRIAEELGLDLVEVSPTVRPPVCRCFDYGKYKYLQAKREKDNRNPSKGIKEVVIHPKTTEHDLSYRVTQIKEWLEEGHKVHISCQFKGREIMFHEIGRKLLDFLIRESSSFSKIESPIRLEGKKMSVLFAPK